MHGGAATSDVATRSVARDAGPTRSVGGTPDTLSPPLQSASAQAGARAASLRAPLEGAADPGRYTRMSRALVALVLATLPRPSAAVPASSPPPAPPPRHVGRWAVRPQFTPGCECGALSSDEIGIDSTRNFCCGAYPGCPAESITPIVPTDGLPNYTKGDGRRDHHHVADGPLVGNGNIGVVVGSGNRWNVSYPWLDLFISTNSFWALTAANHTAGSPFRGRNALPGTMQIGVARLGLPAEFLGSSFSAEQDFDRATITVNLTSATGVQVSVRLFVSPLAPVIWSEIQSEGNSAPLDITLNTTVRDWFYHRDANFRYNASYKVATTASCAGRDGADAAVTRATEFADARVPAATANGGSAGVTGAIYHSVRAPAGVAAHCSVTGQTSASLSFSLAQGVAGRVVTTTVVRVSRDPSCVARPTVGAADLCGLTTDAAASAATISESLKDVTLAQATEDHSAHWTKYWNASAVSLPDALSTELFWYGAQHALNSAIPHAGQEQTPPGLYGPWGTTDNPGIAIALQHGSVAWLLSRWLLQLCRLTGVLH